MSTMRLAIPALVLSATFASGCHRAPPPERVGATQAQAHALAMDETAFFWLKRGDASSGKPTSDGAVLTMPKGGGAVTTLVDGQFLADHIAVDATDVYWSHSRHDPGAVHNILSRVPKQGGAVKDLVDGERSIEGLAVDVTHVFWASGQIGGRIMALAKAGGDPFELAANQSNPRGLALDDENVYWISIAESGGAVHRVAKTGGEAATLAPIASPSGTPQVAVAGADVYFVDGATLMSVPIGGGQPQSVRERVAEFAVDGTTVYFMPTNDSQLMKLPHDASEPIAVAREAGTFPRGFAFDATHVYWSVPLDQEIRRAAK